MAAFDKEVGRGWEVLLIGGAAGTGKTGVSYRLARHFDVGITEIDDFQTVLERMTTAEQQPELHWWRTHPEAFELPAEEILERHLAVARVMEPALEAVIANHLESRAPIVLEGDYLLPSLPARSQFAEVPAAGQVRAVFLVEPDEEQIARNFLQREPEAGEQRLRARVSRLYGEWLRSEAARRGLPALSARPWETLLERICSAIAGA